MWIFLTLFFSFVYSQTKTTDTTTTDTTYPDLYAPQPISKPYGTTYGFDSYTPVGNNQVLRVGCSGTPLMPAPGTSPYNPLPYGAFQGQCNPKQGDTPCYFFLPILCMNRFSANRPCYPIPPGTDFFNGWTEGDLALTTTFYQGTTVGSKTNADYLCSSEFGPGWRMAHFNDGIICPNGSGGYNTNSYCGTSWPCPLQNLGGWHYNGWGVLYPTWTRFWVYVWNYPSNCF